MVSSSRTTLEQEEDTMATGGSANPLDEAVQQQLQLQPDHEDPDEEQLKRILQCKRLSEGCNRFNLPNYLARKNSLHSMMMQENGNGGLLPPVTEGEPMRNLPASNNYLHETSNETGSSSTSSRSGSVGNRLHLSKRHSSQDAETSCSSSTSLDGKGSPTGGMQVCGRRRSSTVSQCSSVLSEGTRQQLNFDLSPDLPPDSSILEANAIYSPTAPYGYVDDDERPASPEPEPLSPDALSDGRCSLELRPVSRMSLGAPFCFEADPEAEGNEMSCDLDTSCHHQIGPNKGHSPDSTLGDSRRDEPESGEQTRTTTNSRSERRHEEQIRDNLERLISEVSTVKVSNVDCQNVDKNSNAVPGEQQPRVSNKRAHTPFGSNTQRNKVGPFSGLQQRQQVASPTPNQS